MSASKKAGFHPHSRTWYDWGIYVLTLFLLLTFGDPSVAAQDTSANHISLYILIDSSGSMKTADPDGLRWTATRLLASLLNDGDEIAVLSFNSGGTFFEGSAEHPYGPLIRIGRDVDKDTLLKDLDRFAEKQKPNGWTNMEAAFASIDTLIYQARSDSNSYVIFLTDGLPEMEGQEPEKLKKGTLEKVATLNVPLYAGGLWPKTDCQEPTDDAAEGLEFLKQMIELVPQGQDRCISAAHELPGFFLASFGQIADRDHWRPDSAGRFEVHENQQGVIRQLTLIYVENEINCRDLNTHGLCVPVYDPQGHQLILEDLSAQDGLKAWFDNDFLVISVRDPQAGTWLVDGDPANTHAILETGLRLEITAPETGLSRQAVHQRLPVQVRLYQVSNEGVEGPIPEGYEPIFLVQRIRPLSVEVEAETLDLNLAYDPTRGIYEARTPPLDEVGIWSIEVEAEVGGFKVAEQHRVDVQSFPNLVLEDFPTDNVISLRRNQQAQLKLVPRLDGIVEPITDLDADDINLVCDGQSVEFALHATAVGSYSLAFEPPQSSESECVLEADGQAKHLGTPYHFEFGPARFLVRILPELRLEIESQDLGDTLPFDNLVFGGAYARLFAKESARISVRLGQDDPLLGVSVNPEIIVPGEETSLEFTLSPKPDTQLEYGSHEGTVVIETPQGLLTNDINELHYSFELVQPSVTHNITEAIYSLREPIATWEDDSAVIPFQLMPLLPTSGTLAIRLTDESGNLLTGIIPHLNTTTIPVDQNRTYLLRLEGNSDEDPWPANWLRSRPIAFDVTLDAGSEVRVLPVDTFHVTAIRKSQLSAWWAETAEIRTRLERALLWIVSGAVGIWLIIILAWMFLKQTQYVQPAERLVQVHLPTRDKIGQSGRRVIALGQYHRLKNRLFGIYFCVGGVRSPSGSRLRLFPASAFWKWLLSAHKPDVEIETDQGASEFRLYTERGFDSEPAYRLRNLGDETLQVHQLRGIGMTVKPHESTFVTKGDTILVSEESGLHLGELPTPKRSSKQRRSSVESGSESLRYRTTDSSPTGLDSTRDSHNPIRRRVTGRALRRETPARKTSP